MPDSPTETARSLCETSFMGWPAFALRQGALTLHVVPSVGGRLMSIHFDDEELCFIHPALVGCRASDDPVAWAALCGDWSFPLWGGGKTWLAPESAWPGGAPHRDLDSGAWEVTGQWCDDAGMGIDLLSPVCRDSGLQLRRRIGSTGQGTQWWVEHGVVNRGTAPQHCGLWDVLMLRRPALVSVTLPRARAQHWRAAVSAVPGMRSVDDLLRDAVLRPGNGRIGVACDRPAAFKCGFDSDAGAITADLPGSGGMLRYQRRSAVPAAAVFAHGHPLEVFNAPALPYFEIESHSPAVTLQPGESASFLVEESVQRLPRQPPEGAHT